VSSRIGTCDTEFGNFVCYEYTPDMPRAEHACELIGVPYALLHFAQNAPVQCKLV
jgi:hypothetical protein